MPLPVEEPPHADDAPGAGTILVVEDAPALRALLVRLLTEAGYQVLEAPDAGSAVDILRGLSDGVDLLLTDVVLPDTSGPELVASIEDEQPTLPVIYVSGYTDDAIAHHGLLAEGTSFIENRTGRILYINHVDEGYDRDSVIGMQAEEIMSPDSRG